MRAIQDFYPTQFAHCHGCGAENPLGMQLKSYLDGELTVARHTPTHEFSGGVPDHVYGGLIASLLDCHGTASAAAFARREREGGTELMRGAMPRFVTGTLTVRYAAPTPMGTELILTGRLRQLQGRNALVDLELQARGQVCATAEIVAIELRVSGAAL